MNGDPWKSKSELKDHLKNLKEFGQLDQLLMEYIKVKLRHKIIREPQKGKEDGKDIVAVEDPRTGEYCCYIVKKGNLTCSILKGKCGVLNQMEEALFIDLEEPEYRNKKRTAVVVHNGEKITRDANKKFYFKKIEIEQTIGELLLRPIKKWNLDHITEEFFSLGNKIRAQQEAKLWHQKKSRHHELNLKNFDEAKTLITVDAPKDHLKTFMQKYVGSIEEIESEYNL